MACCVEDDTPWNMLNGCPLATASFKNSRGSKRIPAVTSKAKGSPWRAALLPTSGEEGIGTILRIRVPAGRIPILSGSLKALGEVTGAVQEGNVCKVKVAKLLNSGMKGTDFLVCLKATGAAVRSGEKRTS